LVLTTEHSTASELIDSSDNQINHIFVNTFWHCYFSPRKVDMGLFPRVFHSFVSSLKYLVGESKTTLVQSIISFHSFHT